MTELERKLSDRVLELEVTLAMCESRLNILATGGKLPGEALLDIVLEARRVLKGKPGI